MSNPYKKNYLTKVIFRLDFFDNVSISNLSKYINDISEIFPIKEEREGQTGFVEFNFESGEVNKSSQKMTSWVFFNSDKTKKLEINAKYLSLEYSDGAYQDSTDLIDVLEKAVMPFLSHNSIATVNRLGLRYVNEIPDLSEEDTGDHLDWSDYIDPDLIANINFAKTKSRRLARIMTQMVIKEELGDVLFNYGIWNNDYPNEIISKRFILDLDCFTKLGVDTTDIVDFTKSYNKYIEDIFEQSISETLRNKMKE